MKVDKGEFLLKGCSLTNNFELSFEALGIRFDTIPDNVEKLSKLRTELPLASETSKLTIIGNTEKEKLSEIAVNIINLLSIAIGRRVIFDRQVFWKQNTSNLVERAMSKNENEGEQIIPDFEINRYLTKTLPLWTNFTKAEKDDIFTITDYLNQTRHDFIEDRILRTVQAWECSANYWMPEPELSTDLIDLKERIKRTYQQWKDEKNYNDVDGELGKRLTTPFHQEQLMLRLDRLVTESRLNTSKINLNLKKLKNLRDQVAHTGRINIKGSEAIKDLQPGIRGLQLIVLRRLDYDGKVYGEKDGWRTIEDIKEYFV